MLSRSWDYADEKAREAEKGHVPHPAPDYFMSLASGPWTIAGTGQKECGSNRSNWKTSICASGQNKPEATGTGRQGLALTGAQRFVEVRGLSGEARDTWRSVAHPEIGAHAIRAGARPRLAPSWVADDMPATLGCTRKRWRFSAELRIRASRQRHGFGFHDDAKDLARIPSRRSHRAGQQTQRAACLGTHQPCARARAAGEGDFERAPLEENARSSTSRRHGSASSLRGVSA